ncbi:hypothetical protein NE236_36340 [Actinoallomurus purpureus]|nr:hypothetical protein [Actinoallomurus purpureus]MCO6010443.1 hypothetical protein [Actinoallomurus purpureus]
MPERSARRPTERVEHLPGSYFAGWKRPPGIGFGACADPFGGQTAGGDGALGSPDGGIGPGTEQDGSDGALFEEPVPPAVGGRQPDLQQLGAEPGEVEGVRAIVVAEGGVAGERSAAIAGRAGRALRVGAFFGNFGGRGAGDAAAAVPNTSAAARAGQHPPDALADADRPCVLAVGRDRAVGLMR